jgi:hypothetical protein
MTAPNPTPEPLVERVREMAKQASLGHTRFCVGIHDHGAFGVEEEWVDWDQAFAPLLTELTALRAEVGALKADKARLDWLERNTASVSCNYSTPDAWQVDVDAPDFGSVATHVGKDIRAAIDAARSDEI